MLQRMDDWRQKHLGHSVEFHTPQRRIFGEERHRPSAYRKLTEWLDSVWSRWHREPWWMEFDPNADVKIAYAASAAFTITLASLATSSTLLTGREGTAISNTTNLYLDYNISGKITVGTTPTANTLIELWMYGRTDDAEYPGAVTGSDAALSFTNDETKRSGFGMGRSMSVVATTSDVKYSIKPFSVARIFGDIVPKNFGPIVTHSSGVNLNSTAGNQEINYWGAYVTSA